MGARGERASRGRRRWGSRTRPRAYAGASHAEFRSSGPSAGWARGGLRGRRPGGRGSGPGARDVGGVARLAQACSGEAAPVSPALRQSTGRSVRRPPLSGRAARPGRSRLSLRRPDPPATIPQPPGPGRAGGPAPQPRLGARRRLSLPAGRVRERPALPAPPLKPAPPRARLRPLVPTVSPRISPDPPRRRRHCTPGALLYSVPNSRGNLAPGFLSPLASGLLQPHSSSLQGRAHG